MARFLALDATLGEHAALWRPRPFHGGELPWQAMHPGLHAWLLARSDAEVQALEDDADALCIALARHVPAIAALPALVHLPGTAGHAHPDAASVPTGFEWGIDGRKWAQVRAFVHALAGAQVPVGVPAAQVTHVVDWCAGKAHLSRWHAHATGVPGIALEANAALVAAGNALARARSVPVTCLQQDVLARDADRHLGPHVHAVALHACGHLHLRLLRLAAGRHVPRLSLSPCCHHLCADDDTTISELGRGSALRLAADELHLAVQETVTSGRSRQRQRERESAWRLGFDALQRRLRGVDAYLPVPSAPRALLRGAFADFVRWAAARKQVALPATLALDEFEQLGRVRHAEVSRLALLRHAFRRPLELRIVFDRARYLEEQGYAVQLRTFCARSETPRNLLLEAWRHPD